MCARRIDAGGVIDMLSDVDTDAEREDEIGEPVCTGSDEEFSTPDCDNESPSPDSNRYYNACIAIIFHFSTIQ